MFLLDFLVNRILKQDSRNEIVQKAHEATMREIDKRIKKASEDEQEVVAVASGGRSK